MCLDRRVISLKEALIGLFILTTEVPPPSLAPAKKTSAEWPSWPYCDDQQYIQQQPDATQYYSCTNLMHTMICSTPHSCWCIVQIVYFDSWSSQDTRVHVQQGPPLSVDRSSPIRVPTTTTPYSQLSKPYESNAHTFPSLRVRHLGWWWRATMGFYFQSLRSFGGAKTKRSPYFLAASILALLVN